jgi:hypothetical protein
MPTRSATERIATAATPSLSRRSRAAARIEAAVLFFGESTLADWFTLTRHIQLMYTLYTR